MAGTATKTRPEVGGGAGAPETGAPKPAIVRMFESAGLVLGKQFREVWTVNGLAMKGAAVVGVHGAADNPAYIMVTFREVGTTNENVIPYPHITRLVR